MDKRIVGDQVGRRAGAVLLVGVPNRKKRDVGPITTDDLFCI